MTGPQFFGALVRAMGVYWLTTGISYLAGAYFASQGYTPLAYVVYGTVDAILGSILMFKADGLVETCYSKMDSDGYSINT